MPTLCEGADDGQRRGAIGIIEGLPRPYRLDVRAVHGAVAQADREPFLAHCQYENAECSMESLIL